MNFLFFPVFLASFALYPLWRLRGLSVLPYDFAASNPFIHCVELIRSALYGQITRLAFAMVLACLAAFLSAAVHLFEPCKGLIGRRRG